MRKITSYLMVAIALMACQVDQPEKVCENTSTYSPSDTNDGNYDSVTVFLPNAFTPNFDGVNDVFFVNGYKHGTCSGYNLKVSRNGDVFFTTQTPYQGWDGTHNGVMADPGSYKCEGSMITPSNITISFSGTLSLITNKNQYEDIEIDSCKDCLFGDVIDNNLGYIYPTNEVGLPCN